MNPLSRPLHLFIIICLLIFGGLYYHGGEQEQHYRERALPYLEAALGDISQWRAEPLWQHLSAEAQAAVNREQLDNLLVRYRPLGRFQSMDAPQFSRLTSSLSLFSAGTKLGYSFQAHFEHGQALVTTTLSDDGSRLAIYNFNLSQVETEQ